MPRDSPAGRRGSSRGRTRPCCRARTATSRAPTPFPPGLDYAAVGPEHAWLREVGRTEYASVSDADALEAFSALARLEGILPALESAHAVAWARRARRRTGARTEHSRQPVGPGRQGRPDRHPAARHPGGVGACRESLQPSHGCAQSAASASSRMSPPATPRLSGPPTSCAPSTARAPTSSKWACRSRIRWPTAPSSSGRANARWRPARHSTACST